MKIRRGHKGIVLLIEHVGIAFLGIRASPTGETLPYDTDIQWQKYGPDLCTNFINGNIINSCWKIVNYEPCLILA